MPPHASSPVANEHSYTWRILPEVRGLKGGRMANAAAIKKLILVPAVITLAVTLLRLVGELMHWSTKLFNSAPGGGGALVGIAWLVPFAGLYFAAMLAAAGERPSGAGPAIGYPLLGVALLPAAGFAGSKLGAPPQSFALFGVFVVFSILGALVAYRGWPALGQTLLAYGLAARIPVALVMLVAMLGNWGTHYDVAPPGFPEMGPIPKWLLIGLLPQLTIWIWFTMAVGALFGGIVGGIVALVHRGRAGRPATA